MFSENCSNMDSWWSFSGSDDVSNNNPRINKTNGISEHSKGNWTKTSSMSRITTETHWDKSENNACKKKLSSDRLRLNGGVDDGYWSWPRGKPVSTQWDMTALYWWAVMAVLLLQPMHFPPSSHRMVTGHARPSETYLHLEVRASPSMPPDTMQTSCWTTSICLIVSQHPCVSVEMGEDAVGEGSHIAGYSKPSVRVYFPHSVASVVGQRPANLRRTR